MPKLMPALLALVTCLCVLSPITDAGADTAFVTVGSTKQAPVIDGVLDDPCWDDCIELSNFLSLTDNGIPAKEDTKVYITYDATNLYIGFKCLESHLDPVLNQRQLFKAEAGKSQSDTLDVFSDDNIEIFLSCGTEAIENYYHICINVLGTIYDSIGPMNPKQWDSFGIAKGHIGENAWSLEVSIPLASLSKVAITPGKTTWRANFCRNAKPVAETSSWCPASARGFHCPEIFGELRFAEKAPDIKNIVFAPFKQGVNRLSAQIKNTTKEARNFSLGFSALFDDSEAVDLSGVADIKAGESVKCGVDYVVDPSNMCVKKAFNMLEDLTETALRSDSLNLKAGGEYHFKADIKSDYKWNGDKPYNFFLLRSPEKGYVAIPNAQAPLKSTGWTRVQSTIMADKDETGELWLVKWSQRQLKGDLSVDNVEIIDQETGRNLLLNGDFQNGSAGWPVFNAVLDKGYGHGAEKITYSYSLFSEQSHVYQSPVFRRSLINENSLLQSQFVNFGEKGAYRVDDLCLAVEAPEQLSLVLKSDKADVVKKVYFEIKMPDSCRLVFPAERMSAVEPERVDEKMVSVNGQLMRSYVMEFDNAALSYTKDATWKYVAIPLVFEATALETENSSGTIQYKAWIDENLKESDYHKLQVEILPALAGIQPKSLPLIIWAYPEVNQFNMLSDDQQDRFVSKMAQAGFNYASLIRGSVDKFGTMGIKAFPLLPTITIAGGGFPYVKQFIDEHPEAAARYPDGTLANAIDPAYLLDENCPFHERMKEVFKHYIEIFPISLNWDYEFPVRLENTKNKGAGQIGFSDRNLEAFRKFADISETEALDAEVIIKHFSEKWIDFRCWQNARTARLYRKLIKEIKNDCLFSFYSGYPPDSASQYGTKWDYMGKEEVDLPMCGYGGNNAVMMKTIPHNYFNAGILIMSYVDQKPLENTLVGLLADAGSYMTYVHFVLDGRFFQAASRASAIAADFEEFFLNLKGNRRDELVCGDDGTPLKDVKVILNDGRRLLLIFNNSSKEKLIRLRNKDLPAGFVGIDHDTKALIKDPAAMELKVAPWKVKAVYLCPEKECVANLSDAPVPENNPNATGRIVRWRVGQSRIEKYEFRYGSTPDLSDAAIVADIPKCLFQLPKEATEPVAVCWQVRAVSVMNENKGPWSSVSMLKPTASGSFSRHEKLKNDPFGELGYWESVSWGGSGPINVREKDYEVTHGGEYSLKCENVFNSYSYWTNFRYPGSSTKLPKVIAGEKYVLRAWLKTEGLDVSALVTINALNEEGNGMQAVKSQEIKGTSDWKQVEVEFTVPKDADTFRILFGVNGVGTGWCGDMKLTKIE